MKPEEIIRQGLLDQAAMHRLDMANYLHADMAARAALRALSEQGYAIVPVEPTRDMLIAGQNEPLAELMSGEELFCADPRPIWRAMLDAAGEVR